MAKNFRPGLCAWSLLLAAFSVIGCHAQGVIPEAPRAQAPAPAPPPPPPPPPPKCESLTENCTATEGSELPVSDRGARFTLAPGWKYAQESERSIAFSPEHKSLLTAAEIATSTDGAVLESLQKLCASSAIEQVKFDALKKRFKKPQISVDAKDSKVDLWEVSKATQNGVSPELHDQGPGTVLVFVSRATTDRVIVGLGFVVTPDADGDAEKIMSAVQSLRVQP